MTNPSLQEKCGVIGVYTASNHAPRFVRQGLAALQHRGQESTGISIAKPDGKITTYKNMGLVPLVLTSDVLQKLGQSKLAIGHNRYATSGGSSVDNAQPIEVKQGKYHISIGHNGNIPDVSNLRQELGERKKTTSDTVLVAKVLLKQRPNFSSWEETLASVLPICRGAYNFVIVTNDNSLFGIRDPHSIWSLCLGKLPDGWVIASESVALDAIGADFVRDVLPGEIIKITGDGKISSYFFGEPKRQKHSLFEYVYFARPDSFINGRRVRAGRETSGVFLGKRIKKKNIKLDAVVPVFESGYPAAKGVAKALNLPIVDAITTSNYVGRTFIQPGQDNRVRAVNGKHNIVPDDIVGKKIVVVDDSAVRLTTSKALIQTLRDAGAKEVYLGIASPPVVNRCDLGIDMRNKKDLPAAKYEKKPFEIIEKKIAEMIEADGVIYLPIEETCKAMGGTKDDFYWYPFGGPHPIRHKHEVFAKMKKKINNKPKICVFASILSTGSNLQKIIDAIESGDMTAEICEVFSNREESYSLVRAKKHHIPTSVIPYEGKFSDKVARKNYEKKLITHIKKLQPDIILLSGWSIVLGDTFITAMQQLQIPVINHHPALLTNKQEEFISTSRGKIPVVRGNNKFKASFTAPILVSGLSVHQVLPGNMFDVGPVVMKAEVRKRQDDTLESWEKRNRETEYLLLPTALKRILHVMSYNIDISKGTFPW
jgi:amidophosphoribosyltransferase